MKSPATAHLRELDGPSDDHFRKRFFELVEDSCSTDAQAAALLRCDPSYIAHFRRGRAFSQAFKARAVQVWPELIHYIALDLMPKGKTA